MARIAEWGISGPEPGVLVCVFGVGMEEGKEPGEAGKTAEHRTNYFAPIPVWDPVKGEAVFPKVTPVFRNEAERQAEARIAERVRDAFPVKDEITERLAKAAKADRGMVLSGEDWGATSDQFREGTKPRRRHKSARASGRKPGSGLMELSDGEVFDLGAFQREAERRKLNLTEFRGAVRAGGFKVVHVVAQGPEFMIQGEPQGKPEKGILGIPQESWMTLVTLTDRKPHTFPNPTSALGMLKRMGVKSVMVDIESWRPDLPTQRERRRPDMVDRLKFAHEYARGGEGETI